MVNYLTEHAGVRVCYACLTAILTVTHDQVRRTSWRVNEAMHPTMPMRAINENDVHVILPIRGIAEGIVALLQEINRLAR